MTLFFKLILKQRTAADERVLGIVRVKSGINLEATQSELGYTKTYWVRTNFKNTVTDRNDRYFQKKTCKFLSHSIGFWQRGNFLGILNLKL